MPVRVVDRLLVGVEDPNFLKLCVPDLLVEFDLYTACEYFLIIRKE